MTWPARCSAAVLAVGLTAAGCGSRADLSAAAAPALQKDAEAVAAAARAGDDGALRVALTRLRLDVATGRSRGQLSPARARRILNAAAHVARDVPSPAPRAVVPPVSSPAPAGGNDQGGDGGD